MKIFDGLIANNYISWVRNDNSDVIDDVARMDEVCNMCLMRWNIRDKVVSDVVDHFLQNHSGVIELVALAGKD